jgi:ABC-type uncharacterized transport system substrate-binding protein
MRRREFITFLGGAATAWPLTTFAQGGAKRPLIGYLAGASSAAAERSSTMLRFLAGLREQGYVDGQNIEIVRRFADGFLDRLPALASQLAQLQPAAVLAPATEPALAMRAVSHTIPIVCPLLENPVRLGLIASENRPGRNVTGLLRYVDGLAGKYVELARELIPGIARVGLLAHVNGNPESRRDVIVAGSSLGVAIVAVEVTTASELEDAFRRLSAANVQVVIILHNPVFFNERRRIVTMAAGSRLPTIWTAREFVEDGGVLSYGSDEGDSFRRAATYVVKILRGAKAGDLPVEFPTKFELLVNLKTARALGLEVPPKLLIRADEVIE